MKCEEVRSSLSMYLQQELALAEMEAIKSHLSRCGACSLELKEITRLTQELSGGPRPLAAPSYLEERIRQRFQQRYRKTRSLGRIAVAALAILAVLSTAYAQARTGFLSDFLGFDRGVEEALLRGAGQVVNESKTQDGITVNLHSLVADPNRSVVLYTIEGAPSEADSVSLATGIEPHTGVSVNRYKIQDGIVRGQLETGGHRFTDRVNIQFNQIIFTRSHSMIVPIQLDEETPRAITLPEGAGEVVIEKVEIKGSTIRVTVKSALTELYLELAHRSLYQDGERAMKSSGADHWDEWHLDNFEGQFELEFTYYEILSSTSKPIAFNVKVDRKKVEQHTVIQELNKRVEVETGVFLHLKQLISTASQVKIVYTVEGSSSFEPDTGIQIAGKPIDSMMGREWDAQGNMVFNIKFEPTVSLKNLEFMLFGYQMPARLQEYRRVDMAIPIP